MTVRNNTMLETHSKNAENSAPDNINKKSPKNAPLSPNGTRMPLQPFNHQVALANKSTGKPSPPEKTGIKYSPSSPTALRKVMSPPASPAVARSTTLVPPPAVGARTPRASPATTPKASPATSPRPSPATSPKPPHKQAPGSPMKPTPPPLAPRVLGVQSHTPPAPPPPAMKKGPPPSPLKAFSTPGTTAAVLMSPVPVRKLAPHNLMSSTPPALPPRSPVVSPRNDLNLLSPRVGARNPPPHSPKLNNPLKVSLGIMREAELACSFGSSDEVIISSPLSKKPLDVLVVKSPFALGSPICSPNLNLTPRSQRNNRSKTPPPPGSPMSPGTRRRNISEPVPVLHNHLTRSTELKGSNDGISMPYNVVRTTHIDASNYGLLGVDNNHLLLSSSNIPVYEMSGFLYKLAGSVFKERWFVCSRSILSYYRKQGETGKPRGEIYLYDCEFEREKNGKRPNMLHIVHTPTKKSYYISALTPELLDDWIRALHGSGAVDKDFVVVVAEKKQKEKQEENAIRARELRKKENDYVRAKMTKRSTLKLSNKNMTDEALKTCGCAMQVSPSNLKDSDKQFRIDITLDDQKWTIFRKFDNVAKLYNAIYKLKFVKGMCPPKKAPSSMSSDEFSNLQIEKLQALLNTLSQYRHLVLGNPTAKQGFLRFLAPVGWDDIKPDKFVMPFMFDF